MRFAQRARTSFVSLATLVLTIGASAQAQGTGTKSATTPTGTSAAAMPTTLVTPVPPSAVAVDASRSGQAIVYFGFRQSGMSYRVERALVSSTSKSAPAWQLRQTTGALPCCYYSVVDSTSDVPAGTNVMYRVTTVSPTVLSRLPATTATAIVYLSNSSSAGRSTNAAWLLPPTAMSARTTRVGTTVGVGGSKTVTFDPSVVSVAPGGAATAVGPGVTYVFWVSMNAAGRPIVRGERVTVLP